MGVAVQRRPPRARRPSPTSRGPEICCGSCATAGLVRTSFDPTMTHQIPIKLRVMLCLLSVVIAFGGSALIGMGHPAEKLLHERYSGVLTLFLIVFTALMVTALRGSLAGSLCIIPLSAAITYPAATFAYFAYFVSFEPQRLLHTLNQIRSMENMPSNGHILDVLILLLFVGPTVTLTWLFGAMAGVILFSIERLIQKRT
jgi:hypothetical protein